MTTVLLRQSAGRPLTNAEVDGNFQALNDGKAEVAHQHQVADVDGLAASLSSKAELAGANFTGPVVFQNAVPKTAAAPLVNEDITNRAFVIAQDDLVKAQITALAAVAASGSYNDLVNKPDLTLKADLVAGKVPANQLPSFVDDVLEYANVAAFPATGESGKQYVAINSANAADPSKVYRWSGTVYTEISPSPGSTTDVPEGSNLYFTEPRVIAAMSTAISAMNTDIAGKASANNPSITGDLDLASVGARIRGDFSDATAINTVSFQSSVPNGRTIVPVLPNGTSKSAAFAMYNGLDPANAQRGYIGIDATRVYTGSNYSGSPGVALPYDIDVGGVNRVRIRPTGEVGIGITPTVGGGALQVPNINGGATGGLKNKIINGCMRISKIANGPAYLGDNYYGAAGIKTTIGGWSAIPGWFLFRESNLQDARSSSGSLHYVGMGPATGAGGYIIYSARIEALDAQELRDQFVVASARLTAWATPINNHYIRVYKAGAFNDFTNLVLVAQSANLGAIPIDTVTQLAHAFNIASEHCQTGLEIQVVSEYTGAIATNTYNFFGDFSFKASSKLEPFEHRPVALEEALVSGRLRNSIGGFNNKVINGCCRISEKGAGTAALGINAFGADGVLTYIGGWSAITGTINSEFQESSTTRTSSGAAHFTNLTSATGGPGYITYLVRVEAADALELANKVVTASARATAWGRQIDDVLINIYKANTFNNFGALTLLGTISGRGPIFAGATKDVSFTTLLNGADCINGIQMEFQYYYTGAISASAHAFIADIQLCAASAVTPFEQRPLAIEKILRKRYYRKQALWIGTSSSRTQLPIGMVKVPTISGGGSGFVGTQTTTDTFIGYQTTAALQTIILNSEL
jgi:hypothetical protein